MKAENIIRGLEIIHKSKPESESDHHVRAEHDMIIAGSLEWELSDNDKHILNELGWVADEDLDGWRYWN